MIDARKLAADVPAGPWTHDRVLGGLVIYDERGEPLALVYGGLSVALYLESVAPAVLFGEPTA